MSRGKSGVLVEVDGQHRDLAETDWLLVAPCGCIAGVTLAYIGPMGRRESAEFVMSAEAALTSFYETKAEQTQARNRGFTCRLAASESWGELYRRGCDHTPKWGYEKPTPDGMVWSVSNYGSGRRVHLIPAANDQQGAESTQPLCGAKPAYGWDSRWKLGKPDCEKCIKAAVAQRDPAVAR